MRSYFPAITLAGVENAFLLSGAVVVLAVTAVLTLARVGAWQTGHERFATAGTASVAALDEGSAVT
ncbi:hypothetical protein [Streptomyces rishiriensis]|uniref:hypothetical protein n=1 Tax=Streptomyces rishiriensis TaxID=68264 RepID=UPI001FEAB721|nr:hypothetical protein [Streptomyces rishiriensis]